MCSHNIGLINTDKAKWWRNTHVMYGSVSKPYASLTYAVPSWEYKILHSAMTPETDFLFYSFICIFPVIIVYKTVCYWMLWILQNNCSNAANCVSHRAYSKTENAFNSFKWISLYLYQNVRLLKLWWDTRSEEKHFFFPVTYLPPSSEVSVCCERILIFFLPLSPP